MEIKASTWLLTRVVRVTGRLVPFTGRHSGNDSCYICLAHVPFFFMWMSAVDLRMVDQKKKKKKKTKKTKPQNQIKTPKHHKEFPGGQVVGVGYSALSLLWLRFDPWLGISTCCMQVWQKKKKKKIDSPEYFSDFEFVYLDFIGVSLQSKDRN